MKIRVLSEQDDRSSFRSGDEDLDRFFHKYAGQNQFRLHIGTTYIAVDEDIIRGFATVAPAHLEIDRIPQNMRKRLPNYPIPILRLARLAVAENSRGKGTGKALLRYTFRLAIALAESMGCAGIVVDAKPDAVAFYERLGFVSLEVVEGESPIRPGPPSLFLPLRDIAAAAK